MRPLVVFALLLSLAWAAAPALAADTPLAELPYTPALDPAAMDRSVDPCTDFYAYTCGGWEKKNPIPPDQVSWSVYGKLEEDIMRHVWGLLQAASKDVPGRDPLTKRVGDAFAACMDEATIEKRGIEPLKPAFTTLAAAKDLKSVLAWLAGIDFDWGANAPFTYAAEQDATDATHYILAIDAAGLGLPDRDYYLKTDARSVDLRKKYVAHVVKMMTLAGDSPAEAKKAAADVLRIETALAKPALSRVDRRDPKKVNHKLPFTELTRLAPQVDWTAFFTAAHVTPPAQLNIAQPAFIKALGPLLASTPLPALKHYLAWHLALAAASRLSKPFVDEQFAFYAHTLHGAEALPARWKRCVGAVSSALPEDVGQLFVRKNFTPATKARALAMVNAIEHEMDKDLQSLSWMSPPTQKQAIAKLKAMANKIGYPDKPRDYSSILIGRTDYIGNTVNAQRFESARDDAKIGQPVDRGEWFMPADEVNAYYSAQMNDINFPAGVLQPPLFDPKSDDAPNFGDTGGTIGHELTHGFDDEGREFDAFGNLRDWWTAADDSEFRRRAKCVSDQYSSYVIVDDIHINGLLTLGEDVADLGGLILAYRAWQDTTPKAQRKSGDGLTPEQRFFVGYAQWACANERPENLRVSAVTNPHSPPKYRVNGLVVNMPEFGEAFQCKAGSKMVKPADQVCKVW